MSEAVHLTLSSIRTVDDMVTAFGDEERCRRLLEAMIWPDGRACPACGSKRSIALAGRDTGKHRARPGLYNARSCSAGSSLPSPLGRRCIPPSFRLVSG